MITYRFAVREDIPAILSLVRALAEYEHMEDAVVATPELYEDWLFEKQCARVLLAMDGECAVKTLAKTAVAEGCGRLEWACLDWNEPSIAFYRAQGAIPMDEWTTYRLTGDALTAFAAD